MRLFTEEHIKKYITKNSSHSPSNIHFLCHSPELQNLRDQLESWFDNVEEHRKNDLVGRFFSHDYEHHWGAFWELATSQIIKGELINIDRWGKEGEPDIFIEKNGNLVALEITGINPGAAYLTKKEFLDSIQNKLNKELLPFPFTLTVDGEMKKLPSIKKVIDIILKEINNFDDLENVYGKDIKIDNQIYKIRPQDINNLGNRAFVIHDLSLNNFKLLQRKIKSKKRKLTIPYIVVLGNSSQFTITDFTLECALFGKIGVNFYMDSNREPEPFRDSKGLFPPKRTNGEAINTWLSGIMLINESVINGKFVLNPKLYLNYWATKKVQDDYFKMETFRPFVINDESVTYKWT